VPAARVESAAVFLVDDVHAAPLSRRRPLRPAAPDCGSRLPHQLARGDDQPGRAVRRPAAGGILRIRRTPGRNVMTIETRRAALAAALTVAVRMWATPARAHPSFGAAYDWNQP